MPRKTAARRRPADAAPPSKPWSAQDVRTLRQLAGKEPRARIARALRRSPAAVTFKAFKLRLSLRVRDRSRRSATAAPGKADGKARIVGKANPKVGVKTRSPRKAAPAARKPR
jgi:hypothetical protein